MLENVNISFTEEPLLDRSQRNLRSGRNLSRFTLEKVRGRPDEGRGNEGKATIGAADSHGA